jgi:hypothetical protein
MLFRVEGGINCKPWVRWGGFHPMKILPDGPYPFVKACKTNRGKSPGASGCLLYIEAAWEKWLFRSSRTMP